MPQPQSQPSRRIDLLADPESDANERDQDMVATGENSSDLGLGQGSVALVHDVDIEGVPVGPRVHSPHLILDEAIPSLGGGPLQPAERRWLMRPLPHNIGSVRAVVKRKGSGGFDMFMDKVGESRFGANGSHGRFIMGASTPRPHWPGYCAGAEGVGALVVHLGKATEPHGTPDHIVAKLKPELVGAGYSLHFLGPSGGELCGALFACDPMGPKEPRITTICLPNPQANNTEERGEDDVLEAEQGTALRRRLVTWRKDTGVMAATTKPQGHGSRSWKKSPFGLGSSFGSSLGFQIKNNKPDQAPHTLPTLDETNGKGMICSMARGDYDGMLLLKPTPANWISTYHGQENDKNRQHHTHHHHGGGPGVFEVRLPQTFLPNHCPTYKVRREVQVHVPDCITSVFALTISIPELYTIGNVHHR